MGDKKEEWLEEGKVTVESTRRNLDSLDDFDDLADESEKNIRKECDSKASSRPRNECRLRYGCEGDKEDVMIVEARKLR